jgi:hypothetical protein
MTELTLEDIKNIEGRSWLWNLAERLDSEGNMLYLNGYTNYGNSFSISPNGKIGAFFDGVLYANTVEAQYVRHGSLHRWHGGITLSLADATKRIYEQIKKVDDGAEKRKVEEEQLAGFISLVNGYRILWQGDNPTRNIASSHSSHLICLSDTNKKYGYSRSTSTITIRTSDNNEVRTAEICHTRISDDKNVRVNISYAAGIPLQHLSTWLAASNEDVEAALDFILMGTGGNSFIPSYLADTICTNKQTVVQ